MRTIFAMFLTLIIASSASQCWADDWPQFRGPWRDGKSRETGLMEKWPEGGPPMLWHVEGLGRGFASVSVVDDVIYTTGMIDKRGHLFAITTDGELKWRKEYGPEWTGSFPGTRTTPTVDADRLYIMSGQGRIACFDRAEAELLWKVDTLDKFGGRNIKWGISESVLIEGDRVFCTPGGNDASIVALYKYTGRTIWTTEGLSNLSAYCSPILYRTPRKNLLLTMIRKLFVCADSETGEVVWTIPHETRNDIAAVTPVAYCQGSVYFTSHGTGGTKIHFPQDANDYEVRWSSEALDCLHGGVVWYGQFYGSDSDGNWVCQDPITGEVMFEEKLLDAKGCIIAADGMLYCYTEKGTVALVDPGRRDMELVSSFKITLGEDQHWAHPAISDGVLYIRHGNVLMAFDIAEK